MIIIIILFFHWMYKIFNLFMFLHFINFTIKDHFQVNSTNLIYIPLTDIKRKSTISVSQGNTSEGKTA